MNTGTYINISRAYEVALLGGYSIRPFADLEDYPNALEDLPLIKEFYKDVQFLPDGDLYIEMRKPYFRQAEEEDITSILQRVDKAKKNVRPEKIINTASEQLLKVAYDRLDLSVSRVDKITDIACTIAQLDGSNVIRIEHIAEAINYSHSYVTNLLAIKTYTKEDIIPMLEEVMNMGMRLRQDQLNGFSIKSGKVLLEEYIKKNLT